jgi:hypothetical protein
MCGLAQPVLLSADVYLFEFINTPMKYGVPLVATGTLG